MYDLARPHKRIVGKNMVAIILQDGYAYEHGSRKSLGRVEDLKSRLVGSAGSILCKFCGGTFGAKSDLEEHFFTGHKDILTAEAGKQAPKKIRGTWAPDDTMLKEEASRIAEDALSSGAEAIQENPELGKSRGFREKVK